MTFLVQPLPPNEMILHPIAFFPSCFQCCQSIINGWYKNVVAVGCEFLWQFLGASFVDFDWKNLSEVTEKWLARSSYMGSAPMHHSRSSWAIPEKSKDFFPEGTVFKQDLGQMFWGGVNVYHLANVDIPSLALLPTFPQLHWWSPLFPNN